jgi:hypothetical protein
MGRPLKDINADEVFDLASKGCTQEEIAGHFGCARSVISERFRHDYELGSAASKTSIRSMQFARARKGSDAMLIHLGKVYLGQSDKVDITSNGVSIQPIFERVANSRDEAIQSPTETAGVLP